MKYTNGTREIDVTKGAFATIYADKGFFPAETEEEEAKDMVRAVFGDREVLTSQADYDMIYKTMGYELVVPVGAPLPPPEPELTVAQLKQTAKEKGVKGYGSMTKAQLVEALNALEEGDRDDAGGNAADAETPPAGE